MSVLIKISAPVGEVKSKSERAHNNSGSVSAVPPFGGGGGPRYHPARRTGRGRRVDRERGAANPRRGRGGRSPRSRRRHRRAPPFPPRAPPRPRPSPPH